MEDADRPVAELALLSPAERQQLLDWGGARSAFPAPATLAELFARRARQSPDARALTCAGLELTYGELNRRANQLAWRLRELGVGPEERVGLCVERSLAQVVGVLGIVKAGGAYVPFDPAYPRERLAFLAADVGTRVLVGAGEVFTELSQGGPAVDLAAAELERYPDGDPPLQGKAENLAYVIYTSGSTGRPKGVLVTHRNVVRLFRATEPWFGFGAQDVWTLFHSHAFDFSVWEIWGALLYGGRLVVVPQSVSRTPEQFHDLLESERVTVLNQTPSAFAQLMRVDEEPARAASLADLRLVIFGGEALEAWRLAPWFERRGDERPRLVNMYGITETTVHVTCRPLWAEDAWLRRRSVIGGPLPDLAIQVLDPGFELAPLGIPGELVIGGAGLARGYLDRPELTAERFVPDPVSGEPGARRYRSGDLGRFLPTGELEHLGRIDHQVKIRGFRIELEEIQVALLGHSGVRETVVLAREEKEGERRLIAYVVARPEALPTGVELRRHLAEKLPEYMLPAAFVRLDALPLTENGKVDRKALLALALLPREDGTDYAPPQSEPESLLVEIFEQVLGVDRVGIDDRFFSLGGDSILSLRVRTLAEERGLSLSLQQLLEHQTVRELAARLESGQAGPSRPVVIAPFDLVSTGDRAALPSGVEDAYPLTALQTGMLYHSAYTADSALYHNVSSVRLGGFCEPGALHRAVAELVARHPVLRTAFDLSRYSEPMQLVYSRVEAPLSFTDLRGLPPEAQERLLAAAFAEEQREPFDVAVAPLLRFRVHLLEGEVFQLTWTEHHAILDGWSVASMLAELFQLYERHGRQRDEELPPLAPPPTAMFRDFVAVERQLVHRVEATRYRQETLEDAPRTGLPRWLPATGGAPALPRMREVSRLLEPELTAQAKRLARSAGVPLKSVLLAVHFRLLSMMTGESDLVSGLVVNSRPEIADGERVLGLFLNTLPLRLQLSDGSWLDLIRRAFEAEKALSPFRGYPMAELQRLAGSGALFETAFNFVHFHVLQGLGDGELRVLGEHSFAQTNFPFTASFSLVGDGSRLHLRLEFDEELHGRAQIAGIAASYLKLLAELTSRPEARLAAGSFLAASERQQAVAEWNDAAAPFPALCLHELFDRQAAERPEALAIVAGKRSLTYGELRREANRLAHHLKERGIGPEIRVGLYLERSPEMLVTVLAILKAGGAYVPLPLDYPPERLGRIVQDSRMTLLVTRAELRSRIPDGVAAVLLDRDEEVIGRQSVEDPASGASPGDLAYVLYTSGSTGVPKGVMVPHRGVVNYLTWAISTYGMGPGRRSILHSSLGFDLTITALFGPLLAGGEVHVVAEDEGVPGIAHVLASGAPGLISILKLTPAHMEVLRRELPPESASRVGVLVLGGEALLGEALDFWRDASASTLVVNEYGPTEATVGCAFHAVPVAALGPGPVPIGRPVANARLHVVSADLHLLPTGARGELCVGGDGLARGYLGRPDLTAASFVPDPFSELSGGRLYRTGDIVRRRLDGLLEFLGRDDGQVKLRGIRVELGEIESALVRHPKVLAAVVVARGNPPAERELIAYVVPMDETRPTGSELRQFLYGELAAAVVPTTYMLLDSLPLTSHGKVDRRALPDPERLRPELAARYLAPRDALEVELARIWERVLNVRPIGLSDDFFELGGHSLLAVQLMARIERSLGVRLPMATLLRQHTVERLATVLRQEVGSVHREALVEIEPGGSGDRSPLFLVHPIGGDIFCYIHLARQLAAERGVYGFQVPDTVDGSALAKVEEIAAHYLQSLRKLQPAGPYSLAGWSMGGIVAFEMARQLEHQGASVEAVVLLDSIAPGAAGAGRLPEDATDGQLVLLFAADLSRLLHLDGVALPPGFEEFSTDEALAFLADQAELAGLLPAEGGSAEIRRRFVIFEANYRAVECYLGGACAARLILFRATEPVPGRERLASDLGWGRFSERPIERLDIPCNHYALLEEPHVLILASLLRARLSEGVAKEIATDLLY